MRFEIKATSEFRKGYKKAKKRGLDLGKLEKVIDALANGELLPESNRDHALMGEFSGCRECHIEPDWLLIYYCDNGELVLVLVATGSHSDLFGK